MESMGKENISSRESFTLGGFLGAVMILSVLAGGVGSKDARGSEKVVISTAKAETAAAAAASVRQPGWASAEHDVCDLQLD